ncbi:MAG TPA: hypothetical protein VF550_11390 [Polyangia bacterium]
MLLCLSFSERFCLGFQQEVPSDAESPLPPIPPRISPILPIDSAIEPDFFRNAFERNFGWRIDHILATPVLAGRCRKAEVDMAPRALKGTSDHTIMWAEFE